jgi:hypothetical protein
VNPTNPKTIEESLIAHLAKKGATGEELLGIARTHKSTFTKQALYHTLRQLTEQEIVVKHGKQFSLSQLWITRMSDFFAIAGKQYGVDERAGNDFLSLSDGDKISYSFKSPVEADRFWAHAFTVLVEMLAKKEPLYIYNPHEWFFFARKESEEFLFKELQANNQKVWLICGGATELDRHTAKYFDGSVLQFYMTSEEIFEARNYYLNIFGTYIIEARIDEDIAKKVDDFYSAHTTVTSKTAQLLTELLTQGKTTITITRSKKKADKLKKVFNPYFY